MSMHEHRNTYGPLGETVKAIDQVGDEFVSGLTHLVTRHDHEGGDQPHHHSPEELIGAKETTPVPAPEDNVDPAKTMRLWGVEA